MSHISLCQPQARDEVHNDLKPTPQQQLNTITDADGWGWATIIGVWTIPPTEEASERIQASKPTSAYFLRVDLLFVCKVVGMNARAERLEKKIENV